MSSKGFFSPKFGRKYANNDLGYLNPNDTEPTNEWQELQDAFAHQMRVLGRQVPVLKATIPFGTPRQVFLALGSSLGDRPRYLRRAIQEISKIHGVTLVAYSSVYQTDPVGFKGRDFFNMVLEVTTTSSPLQLLHALQQIELQLGRVRQDGWAARTIDIDILSIDRMRVDIPNLKLPHPRIAERQFVLVPWLELGCPRLPNGKTVKDLHDWLLVSDPGQMELMRKLGPLASLPPDTDLDDDQHSREYDFEVSDDAISEAIMPLESDWI